MDLEIILILIASAFAAGWVDAIIGGGGLILIPTILACLPTLPPATVLGTNKLASALGTGSAAITLTRKVQLPTAEKRQLKWLIPSALCFAALGAGFAASISNEVLRPIVITLLLSAGLFVAFQPKFGQGQQKKSLLSRKRVLFFLVIAALISFYDGVFGPGTGMFLILGGTAILQTDFLQSAALAKILNFSTNIGALTVFFASGNVSWKLGLILAATNICGAQVGARTVLKGGTKLLRFALLTLVVILSVYLIWQQLS
ncbi:MAG: TSUP family transporter [Arcanobacterium sp.]|nr:TSUP family transporter [Arcanobacterium sp.]